MASSSPAPDVAGLADGLKTLAVSSPRIPARPAYYNSPSFSTLPDPRTSSANGSDGLQTPTSQWVHISPDTTTTPTSSPDRRHPNALGTAGSEMGSSGSILGSASSSAAGSPVPGRVRKAKKRPPLKLPVIHKTAPGPDSAGSDDHSTTQITNREYVSPPAIELPETTYLTELREEDLEVQADLGSGAGGVVQKVYHRPTAKVMARKLIHVDSKAKIRKQIIRELKILHDCHHPNIISFYGAFHRDTDISICMEHMDVGSLETLLRRAGPLPEDVIARVCLSTLKGLVYLYEDLHVLHRDLKPANVLINSAGEVKLADFGVAGMTVNSVADTFVGTSNYMSPERITGATYTSRSDIWSLGIMAIELALGKHPYPSSEGGGLIIVELLQFIVNESPPALPEVGFSDEFRDFTARCLRKEADKRSSPKQLLKHPFVTGKGGDGNLDVEWLRKVMPAEKQA